MRIPLIGLPHTGRSIDTVISEKDLNDRLNHNDTTAFFFTRELALKGTLTPRQAGAEFRGHYVAHYQQECARCLEPKERILSEELFCIFRDRGGLKVEEEEDVGLVLLDDSIIDLSQILHEAIILALNIFWSPELGDQDRCSLCGKTQQVESDREEIKSESFHSFGSLLQKAKQKKNRS
jgi:uncharacterized metal-binding protein YceD (DUF177 family)